MKSILIFLLLLFEVTFPQIFPHQATLVASNDSVFSDEEFTVYYTLTGVEGYFYVGFRQDYFEVIGDNKWEGEIKAGEIKRISFQVKLKEKSKQLIQKRVPLVIGFGQKPLNEYMTNTSESKGIIIIVKDYDQLKHKYKTIKKKSNQ